MATRQDAASGASYPSIWSIFRKFSRIAASASTIRIRPLVIVAAARQARGAPDPIDTVG
jgi:septum formation topological specificity factor MinE